MHKFIGDGTGKYNPEATITRAEMATILVRTYNLNTKVNSNNSKLIFSDLKGH
ncbi:MULTISPECIES: S-layer homology domain-containing protein [Bacillus cereus group]|uniref:S-layer homology domain-containing protein n=1 Tax=Bacillus cereus group TaxID=86661 RepID=UPI001E4D9E09|nr:S-layer homology domain-containing protein [Bacillus cereus]